MNKNIFYNSHLLAGSLLCGLICLLFVLAGCGRQQATGSTFGAATGALLGAAVSGHHSQGTGALIGGLAGAMVGGSIGQAADDEEAEEHKAIVTMHHRQHVAQLEEENRRLRDKWCVRCGNHVTLEGAKSCPQCGGELIREKYCPTCTTLFSPRTGYRFCPYCKQQTRLIGR